MTQNYVRSLYFTLSVKIFITELFLVLLKYYVYIFSFFDVILVHQVCENQKCCLGS